MAALALVLEIVFLIAAFGVRTVIQYRRTGSSGWRGFSRSGSVVGDLGGILFAIALGLALAAPVADLAGWVEPVEVLERPDGQALGVIFTIVGGVGTVVAQLTMGDSWRVGVDATERTTLVTGGPFAVVRNPIFSAMLLTALGLALLVPSLLALGGLVALFIGLELHVRFVEEPYLRRVHGRTYDRYASRTGRFVPRVGGLRAGR